MTICIEKTCTAIDNLLSINNLLLIPVVRYELREILKTLFRGHEDDIGQAAQDLRSLSVMLALLNHRPTIPQHMRNAVPADTIFYGRAGFYRIMEDLIEE